MKPSLASLLVKAAFLLVLVLVGLWFWYFFFGYKPYAEFSTKITKPDGAVACRLASPNELLFLNGRTLTKFDVAKNRETWKAEVKTSATAAAAPAPALPAAQKRAQVDAEFAKLTEWSQRLLARRGKLELQQDIRAFNAEAAQYHAQLAQARKHALELNGQGMIEVMQKWAEQSEEFGGFDFFDNMRIETAGDQAWVLRKNTLLSFDKRTGAKAKEVAIPGRVVEVTPNENSILAMSSAQPGAMTVTRVAVRDGAVKQATVPVLPQAAEGFRRNMTMLLAGEPAIEDRDEFAALDDQVVQLQAKVLERKITQRQAMKADAPSADKAGADWGGNGWGAGALQVAESLHNDAMREMTGGVEHIDESRYAIALRNVLGGSGEWKGEVCGAPAIYAHKTVAVLAAGANVSVFDKACKKLWDAKLAYPISAYFAETSDAPDRGSGFRRFHPCVEDRDRLYIADKGFLTGFELRTGKVLWRLPSVGISDIQIDDAGMLYVTSTTAGVDAIKYSQQSTLRDAPEPVVFKVDPGAGKVLWKLEKFDRCFVTGKYVYATRVVHNATDEVERVFKRSTAIKGRFLLYRVNPRTGAQKWQYFQPKNPLKIEANGKEVALLFSDELQVVTSLSL
jgi:putative pyrroloquinoline-quinone binding quinoprotein